MANNKLTAKEVTLISDLLKYEESACKKARLYSTDRPGHFGDVRQDCRSS